MLTEKIKNYILIGLILISGILGYLSYKYKSSADISLSLLKASVDTLHKFKTSIGNQGAYISTLQGSSKDIIPILSKRKTSIDSTIADSLKKDKKIETITGIITNTKIEYKNKLDSSQRKVNLEDSIKTKWYDAYVKVKNDTLAVRVHTREELIFTNKLKSNKGLWNGSTLTSYAISKNLDTDIIGITSISTVVNKSKVQIRPMILIGVNSDSHGQGIRFGFAGGVGITFK